MRIEREMDLMVRAANGHLPDPNLSDGHAGRMAGMRDMARTVLRMVANEL